MDHLSKAPLGALILIYDFVSTATLLGSRGRARKYKHTVPADSDWDWAVFNDGPCLQRTILRSLCSDYGFRLHERQDGGLTASGMGLDLSVHPTWKTDWIPWVWYWQEMGASKEDSYRMAMAGDFTKPPPERIPPQLDDAIPATSLERDWALAHYCDV